MKVDRNGLAVALLLTGAFPIMSLDARTIWPAELAHIESLPTEFGTDNMKIEKGTTWAQLQSESPNSDKPEYSTGRTSTPETKGQLQPQGWTGPIDTTTGGAPASSPQGQSPPGMQAAPEGSSKTTVAPNLDKDNGK